MKKILRNRPLSFLGTDFGIFLAIFSQNFSEYRKYFKKFCEKKSKNRTKYGAKKDRGRFLNAILFLKDYLNGNFAYKKYLENFAIHQNQKKPLSKDEFLRNKRLRKGEEVRCC